MDLTILVSSCDKNSDLWPIFFSIFKKNWPDCSSKIILNTETKDFIFEDLNIKCYKTGLNKPENYSWTERLKDNLRFITTKYTFLILEDFFIENHVNNMVIKNLIATIDKIRNFGALYLISKNNNYYPVFYDKKSDLYKRPFFCNLRVNISAGIWNTNYLNSLIKKAESPWEFEINASKRAFFNYKKFFCLNNYYVDLEKDNYKGRKTLREDITIDFFKQIVNGKWSNNAVKFLEKNNIDISKTKREIIEFNDFNEDLKSDKFKRICKMFNTQNEFLYSISYIFYFIKKLFKK